MNCDVTVEVLSRRVISISDNHPYLFQGKNETEFGLCIILRKTHTRLVDATVCQLCEYCGFERDACSKATRKGNYKR